MLAAAVSAVPLLYLGVTVAGLNAGQVLGTVAEDRTVRLLTTTLLLAGTVTAGSVLLGLGTAYALHAWDFPAGGCSPSWPACRWPCRPTSRPTPGSR